MVSKSHPHSATAAPLPAPIGDALDQLVEGIGIFDPELKLVYCNEPFRELRNYPESLCRGGVHLSELYRHNAQRGDYGHVVVEEEVERRMARAEAGEAYEVDLRVDDNTMLHARYRPIPAGGLLYTYEDVTEKRKMEESLRTSEERYAFAIAAINEGVYDWDIEKGTVIYSERVSTLLGIPSNELETPRDWLARIHPVDVDGYELALAAHFKGQTERFEYDYRYRAGDGSWRWARQHGLALRSSQGRAYRMIGSTGDITELKEHERELAEKTAILQTTLENIDQGITLVDADLKVIAFNRKFLQLLDFPPERFKLGYHMEAAFRFNAERGEYGPGDVEQQVQERLALARKFEAHHFERIRPDGTVIEIRGKPLPNASGFVSTYTDITKRKRSEQALLESEERYALATRAAVEGIYEWDLKSDSLYLSDRAKEYLAFGDEPLTPAQWNERIHADDFKGYRLALAEHFKGQTEQLEYEYRISDRQGGYRWLLDRGIGVRDEAGRVVRLLGAISDITARKEAEIEIRRAHQELAQRNERLREEIEAHRQSKATIEFLVEEISAGHNFHEIVGRSPTLTKLFAHLERVAATDSTVLILGESGTGKELVARAIHGRSRRAERPLVKVNCAALPRELVESELFGHEKGAFTGATQQRRGRFELANGGTIFLDEVGELPTEAQAKLLRVLQEQEFERVGGSQTLHCDVRVIAATNRDLEQAVVAGEFRSDLYYRLNVFPVTVPPLRARREDIPLLANHFLDRTARRLGRKFDGVSQAFLDDAMHYHWPGNVRELENVVERAAILSPGPILELAGPLGQIPTHAPNPSLDPVVMSGTLQEVERTYIHKVLTDTGWVIEGDRGAARVLGLNPSTLRGRMRKLEIKKPA